MPRKASELNALAVQRITAPGLHFVGGVPGLALQVLDSGARTWVLRMMVGGRRRDMGLGGYPAVPLARARESARDARDKVRQGIDPIEVNRAARSALQAARATAMTFEQCATKYIAANRAGWRNAKHADQWTNTLAQHAYPILGNLLVQDVGLSHVMAVLEQPADRDAPAGPSLWAGKTETASRVRGRIESVLDWAAVRGLRSKDNPARWRGRLDKLLPKPTKVAKVSNHPALPITQLGAFMQHLRQADGMGARALEFTILTAARSGEVRGATWGEFDMAGRVWTVPATKMKAGRDHRVPLSDASVTLLEALPRFAGSDLVFPSARGKALSDATLAAVVERMHEVEVKEGRAGYLDPRLGRICVPHGFRSTFRDWCSEFTGYPREVAEMALAHSIGDKVEAAYRRGELFDKRVRLMADWAAFLAGKTVSADAVVEVAE